MSLEKMIPPETSTFVVKSSSAAAYGSSGAAILFGLTANELAALGGLTVAVVGMVVNAAVTAFYKHKHFMLAKSRANLIEQGDDE